MSEASLREKVRLQLRDGALPTDSPRRVYGGLGIGVSCNICGRPVASDENELQLQFVRDTDSLSIVIFHLHPRCYAAWELERSR